MVYLKVIQKNHPNGRFCVGNHRSKNVSEKTLGGDFSPLSAPLDPPIGPLVRAQGLLIACVGPPWVHAQSPSITVVATCRALECMRGAPRMHRRAPVKTLRHGCFMQNFSTISGCDVPNWKNDGLFCCTFPKKECFYSLKCQISSKQHTVLRQCRLKIT